MNQYFKDLVTHRALDFKLSGSLTGEFGDSLIANNPELANRFKNVCAPIPLELADRLENLLGILRLSKRDFLTQALYSAIEDSEKIMEDVNVMEYHLEAQEQIRSESAREEKEAA